MSSYAGSSESSGSSYAQSGSATTSAYAGGAPGKPKKKRSRVGGFLGGFERTVAPVGHLFKDVGTAAEQFGPGFLAIAKAYGHDIGNAAYAIGHPGARYHSEVGGLFKGVGRSYKEYYGHDVLHHLYEHPLQPILDVLTVATGGGSAAAQAGRAGLLGARGAELAQAGSRAFTLDQGQQVLRATSTNPFTRGLQDLRHNLVIRSTDAIEQRLGRNLPIGQHARGLRLQLKRMDRKRTTQLNKDLHPYDVAFRGIPPAKQIAVVLHAQGLAPTEYLSWLRTQKQSALDRLGRAETPEGKRALREEAQAHDRLIGYVEKVSPELYDSIPTDPRLSAAREAASTLTTQGGDVMRSLQLLSPQSELTRPWLSVRLLRGMRYTPAEKAIQDTIETHPGRAALHGVIDSVVESPELRQALADNVDSLARSWAESVSSTPEEVLQNTRLFYDAVQSKLHPGRTIDPAELGDLEAPGTLAQTETTPQQPPETPQAAEAVSPAERAQQASAVRQGLQQPLQPHASQTVGDAFAEWLMQRVGHEGGIRGAYQRTPEGGVVHVAQGTGDVDTFIHEFAHHARQLLTGTITERQVARWAGASGTFKTGYSWGRAAEERFANGVLSMMRDQPGPIGDWLRRVYAQRDLPELPPHVRRAMQSQLRYDRQKGGLFVGGPTLEEAQAELPDLIYFPHTGVKLREGQIPLRHGGAAPPAAPGIAKLNKGIRFQTSRWLPSPTAWRDSYIKAMAYAAAKSRGEFAVSIARPVGENLEKHPDWYYVRISDKVRPNRMDVENGALNDEYRRFEEDNGANLEGFVNDNLASSSTEAAQRWKDEGATIGQISPADYKAIFGGFRQSSEFVRRFIDNPTNFWRTLTLTYRPAWVVNNFVGQTLLFAINHAGHGAIRAYASAVLDSAKHRDTLPNELRYGGFIRSETPAIKAGGLGSVRAFENKWRERITRLNAEISDNIPRNAAYKAVLRQVAKTNDELGQMARAVRSGAVDIHDPSVVALHDRVIEDVLGQLIDFGDLSSFERTYVRRIFPFYSWIKGITKATGKLGVEHPARLLTVYLLGMLGDREAQREFGAAAKTLGGFFSIGKRRGLIQRGLATTGINPYATVAQVSGGVQGLATADQNPLDNPFLQANPIFQNALEFASGTKLFSGEKYKQSRIAHLAAGLGITIPQAQLIDNLIDPKNGDKKLSPQRRLDLILRYAGLPVTQRNISVAEGIAAKQNP